MVMTTHLDRPAGIFAPRYRALTVGMVALISLVAFEYLAVATAMPVVADDLHGHALYGLAFSGAMAAGVVATVLGGRWGDVRGPVAPLWAGVTVFAAGLVLAGTAPTMDVFLVGRFVQGFGGGVFQVSMYVLVSRVYPAEIHPRVFSVFATAWVLPSMIGPAVTGAVVQYAGWRWIFIGVLLFLAPAALLLWRGLSSAPMPERAIPAERPPIARRLGWAVLVAVGAALMQYGGALMKTDGVSRGAGVVLLAAGFATLAAALPRLLPTGTLRAARGLPAVVAMRGIAAGAAMGGEAFLPLMLNEERGLSLTMAGLTLTGGALSWSFGSWVVGRRSFDRVAVLRAGSVLIAAGLVLMALTVFAVIPVATAFLGEIVLGLGMGIVYPTLSVLVLELSRPGEEGDNSASLGVGESVYTVVTVAVTGAVLAALGTSASAYVLCFALTALVAVAGVPVARRVRGSGA
ncbi:MFS family permease [Streptosporangium becharense]|uniref:MFS family permease n=1 Tax=Streptosporangium becharense TaxID=1816182 RepID=A0A7W9IKY5_9ACTN|nr:MFS transporter [Streptosporangium becharense]MBB2911580.1 MFS family permease [Streptosporangium becharense]MBB5822602.1 MFS family permease [Streptosporangium becharense]